MIHTVKAVRGYCLSQDQAKGQEFDKFKSTGVDVFTRMAQK